MAEGTKAAAVIGASGFVGAHIVQGLLRRGYRVHGTARSPEAAKWLHEACAGSGEASGALTLHTAELGGPARDAQLDEALRGAGAAFFCAGYERQEPETIEFMVGGALATIRAARRSGVGAVVLTSSGGSTNPPGHSNATPKKEHEHWSDPEVQRANGRWSPAAKTLMEIEALREVGRNQRNEVVDAEAAKGAPRLCIMNPNLILGPQLNPGPIAGNSLPWFLKILRGQAMAEAIPNDSMSIIDVRDLAELHVSCAELPEASGRHFGVNRSFPWEEILASLERACPGYRKPPRFEGEAAVPTQFDFTRRDSLGVALRSLDETLADLVAFFRARGALA